LSYSHRNLIDYSNWVRIKAGIAGEGQISDCGFQIADSRTRGRPAARMLNLNLRSEIYI